MVVVVAIIQPTANPAEEGSALLALDPAAERVRQDVARGLVTARGALADYGVALDPITLEIDKTATDEERRRRARDLPLIDRGQGFQEAETRWRAAKETS